MQTKRFNTFLKSGYNPVWVQYQMNHKGGLQTLQLIEGSKMSFKNSKFKIMKAQILHKIKYIKPQRPFFKYI